MTRDWPRISVITPSYNQGQYLEQTILSVLSQNYPHLEYIIIDGGSTDDSVQIIRKYADRISRWVSEPDSGQSEALEKGFALATGEIAAWINSDDYYEQDALYKVARAYQEQPFSFYCGTCRMVDPEGKQLRVLHTPQVTHRTLTQYWKPHFCPPQPSIFFRRGVLHELGGLDRSLHYAMDFDLWLRASRKYSFRHTTENLSYYRVHTDSKTGSPGGLGKFIPEWKQLIERSLRERTLPERGRYHVDENIFLLKKIIRQWWKRLTARASVSP
ncbi:glycosyltransferase family 2 protein [Flavitalea sp. BT771]|uniref:glycosyltransferase family 2 protein n=1 Tax=Flavitalea sp. BT771 TaxID=3063329 RepID=UPI0026E2E47E|nr:glycosyltransferase family 2 protein [Flavitalea sp. BT771]MDO6430407.1 glycosyltransferase family 2 protein [Flavitalea sp. BT771]MDV6219453.1 glycosyltransferase family 2 protein [Flavitalea sp. BT771]